MASKQPGGPGGIRGEVEGPLFTIDFEKHAVERPRELPRELAEAELFDENFFSLQADTNEAAKVSIACQQVHLLNLVSWPEFKTVWGKRCYKVKWWTVCIPWPYIYKRVCTRSYYLQICHPTIGEIMAAILDCLKKSLSEALLALLIQKKFDVFLNVLRIVLVNCLQQKGVKLLEQLSVGIKEQVNCTNWQEV
ncbi:MAG: hypothetical protein E6G92_05280 [Alphaproteobacteria bacterium]|nr:MAG: hypothetical protein E6G92_05280 [Alphaproteobacteria bacterium]